MTNERWRQIRPIFNAVQEMEPERRAAYLDQVCAGRPSLRRDIESLIKAADTAGDNVDADEDRTRDSTEVALQPAPEYKAGDRLGHYEIVSSIGQGGMGVVYRARDSRLGRDVALKVLPAAYVDDPDRRRRLLREARAASQLNHPNIVTIYDVAEEGGVQFIAMEYVEGKTLSRAIPLDPDAAIGYAVQIANALAKAHAAGITHRDLKPANIMLTADGLAKVLDFGMAKLNHPSAFAGSDQMSEASQTGVILGTPAYMSPEQAEGKIVDAQSDIFSFGVVLYEMLSAERPFRGQTAVSMLAAVLRDEPRPLREMTPNSWPELENVVARCLRKDKSTRFQTIAEVLRALQEASKQRSPATVETVPSIAVLPFASMSADKDNEYFSDGLAEEIINALTKLPGIKVTARTSAFVFKGKSENIRRVASELNVGHVLEGSVRKAGNRIRVAAQLISAGDGNHVWSDRYDRELNDIFAIQDEISQAIVDALKMKLIDAEPMVRRHTANIEAYQAYLEGRYCLYQFTPDSMERARESFERAIRLDPAYALAHAWLAEYYYYLVALHGKRPHDLMPLSLAAAERAIALDPATSDAYVTRASVRAMYQYNWTAAGEDFARGLELNPSSAVARYRRAYNYLRPLGRWEEAIAEHERALELDPLSQVVRFGGANLLYMAGLTDKAEKQARSALALFPDSWIGCWISGQIFTNQGLFEEAEETLQHGLRIVPKNAFLLAVLAMLRSLQGRPAEAAAIQAELEEMAASRYVSPSAIYVSYIHMQDAEQAFQRLSHAIDQGDPFAPSTMHNFNRLFPSHPLRQVLLQKMNLSQ